MMAFDERAERALLGSLLVNPHAIKLVSYKVQPADFGITRHQTIYRAMLTAHAAGKAPDLVVLCDALRHEQDVYLAELGGGTFNSLQVEQYAEIVANHALRRQLMDVVQEGAALIKTGNASARDIHARLHSLLSDLDHEPVPEPEDQTGLVTAPLTALLERRFPPVRWIVPEILPVGATILGGKAKMGKTYLALGIALAASMGGIALGRKKLEWTNVLYMALEDGEEILQERCRELLAGHPPPGSFHYCVASPTMDRDGITILEEWLDRHPGTEFVVVDTLKRVRPRVNVRKNAYDEDYEALAGFADLAHRRRLSILILHHLNKNPSVEDPFDELSGSMGIQAAPDTLMVLRGIRGQADAILHVIGRRMKEQLDLALKRHSDLGLWELMGDAADYELRKTRQEIIDTIEEFGEPMSPVQIAATLERNPNTIRVLLSKMVRDQQIPVPHGGRYATFPKTSVNVNSTPVSTQKIIDFWRQDGENEDLAQEEAAVYAKRGVNSGFWRNDAKNGHSVYVYDDFETDDDDDVEEPF